jgi:hypothetical protein
MDGTVKGTVLATVVAGLFGCGGGAADQPAPATPTPTTAATVKCVGINSCATKGECGGLDGNTCAGSNKCAGKGWIKVSADECTAKKGHPLGS